MPQANLLRGLQIGEELLINPNGIVLRTSKIKRSGDRSDPEFRLQAASAFCRDPEDVVVVRNILAEILQALGEPFDLEFVECRDERGGRHDVAQTGIEYALRVPDHDPGTDAPLEEPPAYNMKRDGYFEAVFRVVAAEL